MMAAKLLSLFHAPCGARLSRIRLSRPGGWYDALLVVGKDIEGRQVVCPRCRLRVVFTDLLPSVDDQGFVPVRRPDESGLVGYGKEQDAGPGVKV